MTIKIVTTRTPHVPQPRERAPVARPDAGRAARQKLKADLCGSPVLIRSSEFMDKFPRFLQSRFVKRGANKDTFPSHAYAFPDALLRQEQRKRCVRFDFFLEKFHRTFSRLIHC